MREEWECCLTLSSPTSQSCELGTCQCVGCPAPAPYRAQCWPWRELVQSHMERSLQEAFIAGTCLQLISYLCNLLRKPTKKCFSSTVPLSFVHFIFPVLQRTPISVLAPQIHLRGSTDQPRQCHPMNKQECWAHLDYNGEECVSPPPHTQSHRHFGQPTKSAFPSLSSPSEKHWAFLSPYFHDTHMLWNPLKCIVCMAHFFSCQLNIMFSFNINRGERGETGRELWENNAWTC